ncbi:hypothetical protein GGD67_003857 [Bradyrhizobium sp. IAR9]|uniref:hypothetical protein n=1 Tax=Bradyrhizobium sp. IAR9 TaxID=2663841 RepID=UPI0015CE92D5|nr:hypothetical protein [Bradyrhizobium sp. IAR9]NYG46386.1 hypothetical protein [Bradyrhizobium sp. IAR9]
MAAVARLAAAEVILIYLNGRRRHWIEHRSVSKPDEPSPGQEPPPERARLEQARRVVEEYVESLREIIKKLRRKMN